MRILVIGGTGLLGSHLSKLDPALIIPSLDELDVCRPETIEATFAKYSPDIVLDLAAAMNPPSHDTNPLPGLEVNIIGTANVAAACIRSTLRLVYTCSDYVYVGDGPHHEDEPVLPNRNFYWSKLGGECSVHLCPNSLVLRLSFGPAPFPYEQVYKNQWTSKLYVDEIAPLILAATKTQAVGVMNIGGPRTTLEAYARRTRPDITTIPLPADIKVDTSLDITRMKTALGIADESSLLLHHTA